MQNHMIAMEERRKLSSNNQFNKKKSTLEDLSRVSTNDFAACNNNTSLSYILTKQKNSSKCMEKRLTDVSSILKHPLFSKAEWLGDEPSSDPSSTGDSC